MKNYEVINMYILKVYHRSKYLGFKKREYLEFDTFKEIQNYISKQNLKYTDYELYAKVIL